MSFLSNYLDRITKRGNKDLAVAIKQTIDSVIPQHVSNFSFKEHVISLLVGEVQSGKTSHMLGIISAAADEGFGIFVLLTTDNIILQQQTLKRVQRDLCDFCVCDESDYLRFVTNNMRKPVIIVLKKNALILKQWKNNFASTNFCAGNPLFIVDDEADAASLNTLVNRNRQSTINRCLEEIKRTTSSSIYMQVTATPQAILLQTLESNWKPYFIYYFEPGEGYLGGDFFFSEDQTPSVILTDESESKDLLLDDEFPENGLKTALMTHLISSAQIFLDGGIVSNFLVHPSVLTKHHEKFAEKLGVYLNEISIALEEPETRELFEDVYHNLKETKPDIRPFDVVFEYMSKLIEDDKINILIMNSKHFFENSQYESGVNIIVGGNSLGRGVTIPQLNTVYYCRVAKNPQADTMWQHARMFGYDRDPSLMRVFMPSVLYKLFCDINRTNNNIINQIRKADGSSDIKMYFATGLRPTRPTVLDKKAVGIFAGGANYFPFYPINKDIDALDKILEPFTDQVYLVSMKLIKSILQLTGSEYDEWNVDAFIGFVNTFIADNPTSQGRLIVRRGRDIAKGTGTLLSPNDRALGGKFPNELVLTMYKVTGEKGWDGKQLWIPNIKLPEGLYYYGV